MYNPCFRLCLLQGISTLLWSLIKNVSMSFKRLRIHHQHFSSHSSETNTTRRGFKCFRKIVIWMYEVVGDALQESKRESLVKVDDNLLYNICLEESDYSGLCIIPHYGFHYLLWFIHYS